MHKLYYLPVRARAEPIRMIFAYGNVPFEDIVIPWDRWAAEKPDAERFPFGSVPTLLLPNGMHIAQTCAIARYAGKLANAYPADPEVAAKADMVGDLAQEMMAVNPLLNYYEYEGETWKSIHAKYFGELPDRLNVLQRYLGTEKYFGGETPTFADFLVLHVLDISLAVKEDALEGHAPLTQYVDRMKGIPAIAEYLRQRPVAPEVGRPGSLIHLKK
mmetsp:Transcript_24968/g.41615  ORF Transcript_24968/g.41615 Transcript_24968/m.41615 type:complete len:216 (+) Transcript_24968:48-695(+)